MDDDMEEESQVEYFIDVVEQGNRFGIYKENSFKALSNFKIDISSEVKGAGPLSLDTRAPLHCLTGRISGKISPVTGKCSSTICFVF